VEFDGSEFVGVGVEHANLRLDEIRGIIGRVSRRDRATARGGDAAISPRFIDAAVVDVSPYRRAETNANRLRI
jgi:hypothetical protein